MRQLPPDFLQALQARAARVSLGPSSMRGRGNRGVVGRGRTFLSSLGLNVFGTSDSGQFRRELETATEGLVRSFPMSARHWGLARKGINIFLRECLYTAYLRSAYHLDKAEAFFEVPLDSLSGRALWEGSQRTLPRWKTVKGLTPDISDRFQDVATELSRHRHIARVHLDALWWGQRDDDGA